MSSRSIGLLMAMTTALCWAVLAIALKFSLNYASSGTIVWMRMAVAFLALSAIISLKHPQLVRQLYRPPLLGLLAGLALAANYFGYMKGIELTSASNAQIMIQMAPMMLVLVGIFYFKESPSLQQFAGMALAAAGFAFFYWDQILLAVKTTDVYLAGNSWIAFGAVTWVGFATAQKKLSQIWSPQQINLLVFALATLALAPLADFSELTALGWPQWILLIALGVNTVIAYGALGEALKRIPASQVSLIIVLNPLGTIFLLKSMEWLGWEWLAAEPIDWRGYMGAFLVVSGVAMAVVRRA